MQICKENKLHISDTHALSSSQWILTLRTIEDLVRALFNLFPFSITWK